MPTLRGRVASYVCTPEGRAYLVRLPSVAVSPLDDDEIADLMNFIVFEMGSNEPVTAPRYTSKEVAALRTRPLTNTGLMRYRRRIVERLISTCGAPVELRDYGRAIP